MSYNGALNAVHTPSEFKDKVTPEHFDPPPNGKEEERMCKNAIKVAQAIDVKHEADVMWSLNVHLGDEAEDGFATGHVAVAASLIHPDAKAATEAMVASQQQNGDEGS